MGAVSEPPSILLHSYIVPLRPWNGNRDGLVLAGYGRLSMMQLARPQYLKLEGIVNEHSC